MATYEIRYQLDWETNNRVKQMEGPPGEATLMHQLATQELEAKYGTKFMVTQVDEMYR